MLAGVARIIEASFIVPKFVPESPAVDGDTHSDHTLADPGTVKEDNSATSVAAAWGRAFRHLPPFVGVPLLFFATLGSFFDESLSCSCLFVLGK